MVDEYHPTPTQSESLYCVVFIHIRPISSPQISDLKGKKDLGDQGLFKLCGCFLLGGFLTCSRPTCKMHIHND